MLRVAVIGLGDIANIHIPVIEQNPDAMLVAICDIDESKRNRVEGAAFYTDYEEMLDNEMIDCVHVCLPHYLHYPATKACVERGVHVYQEKPLAHTVEDGRAIVELEERHPEVNICVSFQNRFNETSVKLFELIASGEYGKVTGIKGLVVWYRPKEYYETKPWRGTMEHAGGGVMINQAIHTLDLMQLVGGEVESIRGSIDNLLDYDIEVEDTATANITFTSGVRGLFYATVANTVNSSVEIEVILEKGVLSIKDSFLTLTDHEGIETTIIEDSKLPGSKFYYGASHSHLISHFYRCIEQSSKDYIPAKEAQVTMELIDAIRKSSESKSEIKFNSLERF